MKALRLGLVILLCTVLSTVYRVSIADEPTDAVEKILVLDFELNDLTMNPNLSAEQNRTDSLRPLLSSKLSYDHKHTIMDLDQDLRDAENKGKGYLFDRPSVTARMGATAGADWVVTGRLHKASFLFVYMKSQLIEVASGKVKADFVVEIKGWEPRLTTKGVETLALQIDESLLKLGAEP